LLVTGVSGAEKVMMSGVAHLPNMEKPEEFNQIVFDFLSKQQVYLSGELYCG